MDERKKKRGAGRHRPALHPIPPTKKKTRDYETRSDDSISPERESRLVPNDSPSRREERRLEARFFWIFFSGCERLSPSLFLLWRCPACLLRGKENLLLFFSPGVQKKRTRRLSEKKQQLFFPFSFVRRRGFGSSSSSSSSSSKKKKKKKSHPKDDREETAREREHLSNLTLGALRVLFVDKKKKEDEMEINPYLVFAGAGRFDDAHFSWFRSHVFSCVF